MSDKITAKLSGRKNAIQWDVAAMGEVKAYTVYDNGKMIHFSYVVWGSVKFRFLKKGTLKSFLAGRTRIIGV